MIEAAQVAQFADQGHGGDLLEAFAGHQRPDHRLPFPIREDLLHPGGEALDAFVSRVDGLEILTRCRSPFGPHFVRSISAALRFLKDEVLHGIGKGEVSQVVEVRRGPAGFAGVMEAVAQEEGVEPLFGAG